MSSSYDTSGSSELDQIRNDVARAQELSDEITEGSAVEAQSCRKL